MGNNAKADEFDKKAREARVGRSSGSALAHPIEAYRSHLLS